MESNENFGFICEHCANERQKSWQEHHRTVEVRRGDYVLIEFHFTGPDKHEWMWVCITSRKEDKYQGELSNDSTFDANFTVGTQVDFERGDIADWVYQGNFDDWKPWRPSTDAHGHHHNHEAKA